MGFFYYIHSVALIEDLNLDEETKFATAAEFYSEADKMYSLVSYEYILTKRLLICLV